MLYNIEKYNIDEIIIYLRKSRSDDISVTVEEVLAKHEHILQEYALDTFGQKIPEQNIYREIVSGETIADRPVMQNVLKLLETGTRKACLVIEPQRLSRGDLEDCGRIINTFRYTNTLVMTPPKTYNLSDEYDRKFFEMELMRGNDYLEYTKKILNRGRMASVKQGNFIGSVAPYGYKKITIGTGKDMCHSLAIVEEEAEIIKLMYHLFIKEGYGFAKIARHLDELGIKPKKSEHWSPAAIKDMLENPVYIGKIRWNFRKTEKKMVDGSITKTRPKTKDMSQCIYVNGKHPAIIDEVTFQAALDKRGKNPCVKKNEELSNPFAGMIFCGTCGRAMSYKHAIRNRKKSGIVDASCMICNGQTTCKTRSVKYDKLLERVIMTLEKSIVEFEIELKKQGEEIGAPPGTLLRQLELELKKLNDKDAKQKDAYEDGIYTKEEYASRNAKLQEQISNIRRAILRAKNAPQNRINYEEKILKIEECIAILKDGTASASKKNILLKSCIEKIIYYNDTISKVGIGRWSENVFEIDVSLRL